MTPEDRTRIAKIAANTRWGGTDDTVKATEKARRIAEDRFMIQADPAGVLPPEVRARKAANLRRAFYQRLSAVGVKARQRRRGAGAA